MDIYIGIIFYFVVMFLAIYLLKRPKNVVSDDGKLVIKEKKLVVYGTLIATIILLGLGLWSMIYGLKNGWEESITIATAVALVFAITFAVSHVMTRTRRIVIYNADIHVYGFPNKEMTYKFGNIVKVKCRFDRMIVFTDDNKIFKVDITMQNFYKFLEILESKGVEINNKNVIATQK